MTADTLAMLAGAVLSLTFSYVPKARDWFDRLTGEYKRLVMLGLLAAVAIAVGALACAGLAEDAGLAVSCDRPGIIAVLRAFAMAATANQAAYMLSPRS